MAVFWGRVSRGAFLACAAGLLSGGSGGVVSSDGKNECGNAIDIPGATQVGAAAPEPSSSSSNDRPSIVDVRGPETAINGGSVLLEIDMADAQGDVTDVLVRVSTGACYYELPLPLPAGNSSVVELRLPEDFSASSLEVELALRDARGNVSDWFDWDLAVVQTGVGDVKVSLSFDQAVDLDLHVVEPSGYELYYGATVSPSGGELDLDSNPACVIDGINNENIFWPSGTAPPGEYVVRVDYFDACVADPVDYIVTVTRRGAVETFTGRFEYWEHDMGGQGSGREITRFSH